MNMKVYDPHPSHGYEEFENVCGTLRGRMGTGGGNVPVVLTAYGFEPGAAKRLETEKRFYKEVSPTLRNNAGDNQTAVAVIPMEGNGTRPSHLGNGYGKVGDPSFTLNAVEHHGVAVCGLHGNVAGTIDASYYKGCGERNGTEREVVLDKKAVICLNDQGGASMSVTEDKTATLRAQEHGHQPLCLEMTSTKNTVVENGISPTLTARMGTGGNQVNAVLNETPNSVVRRLTPKEAERLQGFPDDWTDIGEWTDSKGKVHKTVSDQNRYRAIGNSLALPFWQWLLDRIEKVQEEETGRPATLGSLFSGIGGFELCGQRCGMEPLWASEIDEFCIAVTKHHFGDQQNEQID